ncbi:MAG: hypothetical protein ACJ8EE_13715 [Bradyrhizobium sp.]
MREEFKPPPYLYDGLDPVRARKSMFAEASEVAKVAAASVGQAIEAGRKPGMPLSVLSNLVREAPLASLSIAFLLGVIVAPRR